jgi:para-aminobenzoate synthetase component 1
MTSSAAFAIFGNQVATEFLGVTTDPADLDSVGWWAVTHTFEGEFKAFRFAQINEITPEFLAGAKHKGLPVSSWKSSMTQAQYESAVDAIRSDIERGWVYQANLCRVLSAELAQDLDVLGLWHLLRENNPAPYLSALQVPATVSGLSEDVRIVSASPELYLQREGKVLRSSPIKGTAKEAESLLEKDRAENIMIVDLVRNDLGHVCESGSVSVPELLRLEEHPGLVHLVSDIQGTISATVSWSDIFQATAPPGSVSGAPKSSALEVISRLENGVRDIYCGGFGWVDADQETAKLAVGIRTFWQSKDGSQRHLNFGTGAGITWGSDPTGEWHETELKAAHLLSVCAMDLN